MITQKEWTMKTPQRGIYDITEKIQSFVNTSPIKTGLCHVFCQHTSASLILCENYDPEVKTDTETFLSKLVVDGHSDFIHFSEGIDAMPAHLRTMLTSSSLTLPIVNGELGLGRWQGVCLYEHRYQSIRDRLS